MSDTSADRDDTQADALLRVLTRTAGEHGVIADARFRESLDALALDRAALLDALGEARWPAFLAGLETALLAQAARLSGYAADLLHDAGYLDDADLPRLCLRRSTIQYLLDDLADTPVAELLSAAPLADIDARLAAIKDHQGPVDDDECPDGLPETHHWWFSGSADADDDLEQRKDDDDESNARQAALVLAEALRIVVEPLLLALHGDASAECLAALHPQAGDAARVFGPELAEIAESSFAAQWPQAPAVTRLKGSHRLQIHVAPAGMLLEDNELSRHFPGGYRRLAAHLAPQRVWVAWKVIERGASSGMAYDGLVWIDDHWAWFPKPFRVLRAALDALDAAAAG